ncbi:hypothetical protein Cni_G02474 [Canna indica]|uniref:Uncharacterized protein n=1 Tax=Canna indica TaxID=4628 RepID=A0AAQ3Q077_9LILI|nr:hypothetical protein Cni_G02474 [Canna indica]
MECIFGVKGVPQWNLEHDCGYSAGLGARFQRNAHLGRHCVIVGILQNLEQDSKGSIFGRLVGKQGLIKLEVEKLKGERRWQGSTLSPNVAGIDRKGTVIPSIPPCSFAHPMHVGASTVDIFWGSGPRFFGPYLPNSHHMLISNGGSITRDAEVALHALNQSINGSKRFEHESSHLEREEAVLVVYPLHDLLPSKRSLQSMKILKFQ